MSDSKKQRPKIMGLFTWKRSSYIPDCKAILSYQDMVPGTLIDQSSQHLFFIRSIDLETRWNVHHKLYPSYEWA